MGYSFIQVLVARYERACNFSATNLCIFVNYYILQHNRLEVAQTLQVNVNVGSLTTETENL